MIIKKKTCFSECYDGVNGKTYSGTKSTTINGYTCQRWDTNLPHLKNTAASNEDNYPEKSLTEAQNYCRQPADGTYKPWCYTTDPLKRWDYCDIPTCEGK